MTKTTDKPASLIRARAELYAVGSLPFGDVAIDKAAPTEDVGALFRCSVEDAQRIAQAFGEGEIDMALTLPSDLGSHGSLGLGLAAVTCPRCDADVLLATVDDPIIARVLVDTDERERVVERDDGRLSIRRSFSLHAESCPDWPADERDWRTCIG